MQRKLGQIVEENSSKVLIKDRIAFLKRERNTEKKKKKSWKLSQIVRGNYSKVPVENNCGLYHLSEVNKGPTIYLERNLLSKAWL